MKKRKINRAKRVSNSCRNNGACPYCQSSRTHSNKRQASPLSTRKEVELAPDSATSAGGE